MIGVIADPAEHDVAREFFELFKTPWEFYRENQRYEVVLCTVDGELRGTEKLVLCYSTKETRFDREQKIPLSRRRGGSCFLSYQGSRIPIYGDSITFEVNGADFLTQEDSREPAAYLRQSREGVLARIGYELFGEVRALLTTGQLIVNAGMPTLELHIALLRDLITSCGVSLSEIPPVPDGYQFIACLTHDVDHPAIREHAWDHTIFGFLFRAVFCSMANLICERISFRCLLTNWAAVLKLPFVHFGLAEDFWRKFDDRYLELEKSLTSTFFFIPFKNYAGRTKNGPAPGFRAARYQAKDLTDTIKKLMTAGHEIGLHGIDTWLDSSQGSLEMEEIRRLSGISEVGVRMHWLYYDEQSPNELEKAGAAYDSTIGYNETVGYRAGTTQAYKPLEASRLLELPMHVMDTALFYSSYLGLGQKDAKVLLERMVDNAAQYGGCLTVNWHDRSVLPERLWDACYRDLIQDMKTRGAWFSTARQATSWFAKRRSVVFEVDGVESDASRPRVAICHKDNLPGLRFRVHKARKLSAIGVRRAEDYVDVAVDESVDTGVPQ
jgi:peptidoglycan/xylan/chitin deacetylase (PgdA/CDA1 family)